MSSKNICIVAGCERPYEARGFCTAHYKRWQKNPTQPDLSPIDRTEEEAFWSHVHKTATCWLWTGKPSQDGYGRFVYKGVETPAHRKSLEMATGSIPDGYDACHDCSTVNGFGGDNKLCVRQDHLFAAPPAVHTLDRMAKGQLAGGVCNGKSTKPECTPRGERHGNAVLTTEQVRTIRAKHRSVRGMNSALAREYGVTRACIRGIVTRKSWTHI